MAVNNKYILNLDMKRRYTAEVPTFRRGDTSQLIMRIFDDGLEFNINNATSAKVFLSTPSKFNVQSDCEFDSINGKRVIKYTFEDIVMVELGYITVLLVVFEGDSAISIQPFTVKIVDDLLGRAGTYLELVQELLEKIDNLKIQYENMIPLSQKGEPNGVALLDSNRKVLESQLPDKLNDMLQHVSDTVYENQIHGLKINDDGILEHLTDDGYVETILTKEPIPPYTANINVSVVDGVVTATINEPYYLAKWDVGSKDVDYFYDEGQYFYNYNKFNVTSVGIYTIYYLDFKADEAFVYSFEVTEYMLPSVPKPDPNIRVTTVNGVSTVEIDPYYSLVRYIFGNYSVEQVNAMGTSFITNSFNVYQQGTYSITYSSPDNINYLYQFTVESNQLNDTTPPTIYRTVDGIYSPGVKTGAVLVNWMYEDASGIDYIINPLGQTISNEPYNYRYTITENGSSTIRVFDKASNESSDTIEVNNIGTPVIISQLPLGSRFAFCGNMYALIEKSTDRNIIARVNADNPGAFNVQFDYNNATNLFPDATISYYLANQNINGTLGEHHGINDNGSWNYGYVSYIDETATYNTNAYYIGRGGLLTLPQWITAVNNNWINALQGDSEILMSPVLNTSNQIYRAFKSSQGFINVYPTDINIEHNFRLCLQVTDTAIGYV